MSSAKRRPTRLQIANRRLRRAEARLEQFQQRAYQLFRSATAYTRAKEEAPPDAVTLVLSSKWCRYTGYAPREAGTHLLRRLEWAAKVLHRRNTQRNEILAPRRAYRETSTLSITNMSLSQILHQRLCGPQAHPEEVAFLAAIRTEPRERCNWLVYADWLDEHNEPIPAGEIRKRLQVRVRSASRPVGHSRKRRTYVGTIAGKVRPLGPDGWREELVRRGKVVPAGRLVAKVCHGKSAGRYAVFAVNCETPPNDDAGGVAPGVRS